MNRLYLAMFQLIGYFPVVKAKVSPTGFGVCAMCPGVDSEFAAGAVCPSFLGWLQRDARCALSSTRLAKV